MLHEYAAAMDEIRKGRKPGLAPLPKEDPEKIRYREKQLDVKSWKFLRQNKIYKLFDRSMRANLVENPMPSSVVLSTLTASKAKNSKG